MKSRFRYSVLSVFLVISTAAIAQKNDNTIRVIAWPQGDSIILRWAPTSPAAWRLLNKYGYRIERYTILKDSVVLQNKPMVNLGPRPITPSEQKLWIPFGEHDDFVTIAAQSIFGETFEINTKSKSGVMETLNKSTELESRFSFALFAADLSMPAANLSGLRYVDRSVRKEESYLYRVYSMVPENILKIEMGFTYTGLRDYKSLPVVPEPKVEFGDKMVKLSLTLSSLQDVYTGYYLEKSEDGKSFYQVNKIPFVAVSHKDDATNKMVTQFDSLKSNDIKYYYRLVGLTPFGLKGPASKVVSGNGFNKLEVKATGVNAQVINDKAILQWDFSPEKEKLISGFEVERSNKADGVYKNVSGRVAKEKREFTDNTPNSTNYYRVVTLGSNNQRKESFPVLVQLVDSIPPIAPQAVLAKIDTSGIVHLSWKQNTEKDLSGYRVFRSNFKNSEFSQLTVSPLTDPAFADTINLKTLSSKIYYKVKAQDKRSNMSAFSEEIEIVKPDQIPPMAPSFISVIPVKGGIELRWNRSSSEDVTKQFIQCKFPNAPAWSIIATLNEKDSLYLHDVKGVEGSYLYQLIAEDRNGLKSKTSTAVTAKPILNLTKSAVTNFRGDADRSTRSVKLKWIYKINKVKKFMLYRAEAGEPITFYRSLPPDIYDFEDKNVGLNKTYLYRIKVAFQDGSESSFSEELKVNF